MQKPLNISDYDALIFDFDGTLVDSLELWHQIDRIYLSRFGLECPDDLSEKINGMSFTETAVYFKERFNLPRSIEEIKDDWIELSKNYYMNELAFKPGARAFLKRLEEKKIPAAIATSNNSEITEPFFSKNEVDLFSAYSYGCDCENSKPDPEVFLRAAQKLGVDPKKCLAFEDTLEGVLAAKGAGMKVVAVYDEHNERQIERILEESDNFIKSYHEIKIENDEYSL